MESKEKSKRTKPTEEELASFPLQFTIGTVSTALLAYIGYTVLPAPRLDEPIHRLMYTARMLLFSSWIILVMALNVACRRGLTAAINPMTGHEHFVDAPNRILRNTIEQFILHAVGLVSLATFLPPDGMVAIPVFVTLFVTGRLVYWWGYPMWRGPGWDMTIFPTFTLYIYGLYCSVRYGFSYGLQ